MATNLEEDVRRALSKFVKIIEDAGALTVETRFVTVGANNQRDFDGAQPVARTVMSLDGDYAESVPMRLDENNVAHLHLDDDLLALHKANVERALEYRTQIIQTLFAFLQDRRF